MLKYKLQPTAKYRKDRKLLKKQGADLSLLDTVIFKLANDEQLPPSFRDHPLHGKYRGYRECHVDGLGDWLLIYKKVKGQLILTLARTGSHTDLF